MLRTALGIIARCLVAGVVGFVMAIVSDWSELVSAGVFGGIAAGAPNVLPTDWGLAAFIPVALVAVPRSRGISLIVAPVGGAVQLTIHLLAEYGKTRDIEPDSLGAHAAESLLALGFVVVVAWTLGYLVSSPRPVKFYWLACVAAGLGLAAAVLASYSALAILAWLALVAGCVLVLILSRTMR